MQRTWSAISLATLVIASVTVLYGAMLAPSWRGQLTDICHVAAVAAIVALAAIWAVRPFGFGYERAICTGFLALMPLVYVIRCWRGSGSSADLAIELFGLLLFGVLAFFGYRGSAWFLVAGILAHGVIWDAVHWAMKTTYMPAWYEIGCFLADVTLAAYLAARIVEPGYGKTRRHDDVASGHQHLHSVSINVHGNESGKSEETSERVPE